MAVGQQPLQFIKEALSFERIGREYDQQRVRFLRSQLGDQQALGARWDGWQDMALADIRQPLGNDSGG